MKSLIIILLYFIAVTAVTAQPAHRHIFPLRISADNRRLEDHQGKPFLYNADTGWMLFLKLTKEEALEYLLDRQEKGFNVIQVMLTGFLNAKNKEGELPFLGENDFSRPNEAWFKHVDQVVEQADSLGLILAIAPLWSGCCGEGWAGKDKPIQKNGPKKSHQFGEYLGKRYDRFTNLVWIMGGDNDPNEDKEAIRQIALGIKKTAPHHLITYHAASSHSSSDVWENEKWLDIVMIYTYFRGFNKAWNKNQPDVYEAAYKEYNKKRVNPFILGESTYEGEYYGGAHDEWDSPLQARKQAYWAILSGGTGHAYGSPLWNFGSDWRNYLNLPGAQSLRHLYNLFTARSWEKLIPDQRNKVAVNGRGAYGSNDYTTTAIATDGTFLISYLPSPRAISIDLGKLKERHIKAAWFNPGTGDSLFIKNLSNKGISSFKSPGGGDWVLIIEKRQI